MTNVRLIDANALKEKIQEIVETEMPIDEKWAIGLRYSLKLIDNAPTVETTKAEHKAYNEGFKDGVEQGIKLEERPKSKWKKFGAHYDERAGSMFIRLMDAKIDKLMEGES